MNSRRRLDCCPVEVGAHRECSQRFDSSLPLQDERAREQHERDEARHRIARQSDERHVVHVAERQRLARLHRDLPQIERALGLDRRLHVIFLADRYTTG